MPHYRPEEVIQSYVDGTISLRRLAEMLETDPISLRELLHKNGIALQAQDLKELLSDADNACPCAAVASPTSRSGAARNED